MKTLWLWILLMCAQVAGSATIEMINVGTAPNSRDGDTVRAAFIKVNTNFVGLNNAISNAVAGSVNATNLPVTNATVFGVFNKRNTDGVLEFFGIKMGTNMVLYRDGSNIVVNSSAGGSGSVETQWYPDQTQFFTNASGVFVARPGFPLTNALQYGITTNAGDGYRIRGVSDPYFEITSTGIPQTFYVNSRGIGTRAGGGQAYITFNPEETITVEMATDSFRPANGVNINMGEETRKWFTGWFNHYVSASNIFLGPAVKIMQGNLSPEGVISANPQSIWLQTNQTSGIGLWLKTNGTGSSGWWLLSPGGGGAGLADGDKGDITVSSSGSQWDIDPGAVTYAKIQDASATQRVLGRNTSGSGDFEEVTFSQLLDWVGSAAHGDILYRGSSGWNRLGAGTVGQLLQTLGPGVNPAWATVGSLTDNDKGDITVSSSGTVWTIDNGVIVSNLIAASAINSSKILDGTIVTADLADDSVSSNKVVSSAINSSKIFDGTIVTADLADDSVSSNKVVASAINSSKILDGTIATADLADSLVTSNKIAGDAINSSKILDGTVATVDIADGAITSPKIPSGIMVTNLDAMNITNRGRLHQTDAAAFAGVVTNNGRVWLNERINQTDPSLIAQFGLLQASGITTVTNWQPTHLFAGTNIGVGTYTHTYSTMTTNASFAMNFSGTPKPGEVAWLCVSNLNTSAINLTNFNGSAVANCFDPTVASNVTVFPIAGSSIRIFTFRWMTNQNAGTVRQQLDSSIEKRMEIAVASAGANGFLTMLTNAENSIVTISNSYIPQASSMVTSNLIGTVANNVTNENSTALQINTGTLTLSPGNVSNLVNNSTLDFQPNNVITNIGGLKGLVWTNYVQTVSNFVFSFNTNYVELKNQTNVVFTNIVEEATAIRGNIEVHIANTTGVTMGLVWPAYGAQHGYFFNTNANNAILATTSLASGQHLIASFSCFGTNVFATATTWP